MRRMARSSRRCLHRRGRRAPTARSRAFATALGLLLTGLASPAPAQSPGAPIDRAIVAIPPVYPVPAVGFLRLPETRSAPVRPVRPLHAPVPGGPAVVHPEVTGDRVTAERPRWQPARVEPFPVIDARGHITAILEYTPGRFER
jgi:hypothetical protein